MNEKRVAKIRQVIQQSQPDLTVILENIFNPLNISAVLRSCDAVGIREVYVVYTKNYLTKRGLILGKKSSAGTFKWIDVFVFEDLATCFQTVRQRYERIFATRLGENSPSMFDLDLTQPTALLFGNEDEGVSDEAAALCDGNFIIPQVGFAESLNISVACAVTLFEAQRQRRVAGLYDNHPKWGNEEQKKLFKKWEKMLHEKVEDRQKPIKITDEPPLPIVTMRDPSIKKKSDIRPSPLTKFDL